MPTFDELKVLIWRCDWEWGKLTASMGLLSLAGAISLTPVSSFPVPPSGRPLPGRGVSDAPIEAE